MLRRFVSRIRDTGENVLFTLPNEEYLTRETCARSHAAFLPLSPCPNRRRRRRRRRCSWEGSCA